jgi:hypothetical protein
VVHFNILSLSVLDFEKETEILIGEHTTKEYADEVYLTKHTRERSFASAPKSIKFRKNCMNFCGSLFNIVLPHLSTSKLPIKNDEEI